MAGGEAFVEKLKDVLVRRQADMNKNTDSDQPIGIECPICTEVLGPDEVMTECCHSYCRDCIRGLFDNTGEAIALNDAQADRMIQNGTRVGQIRSWLLL